MAPVEVAEATVPPEAETSSTPDRRTGPEEPEKTGRRNACNQCKQQKLRCELASAESDATGPCARCVRSGLECKVESGFRRTRKRRRSFELESEIRHLRMQLEKQNSQIPTPAPVADWIFRQDGTAPPDRPSQGYISSSKDVPLQGPFAGQPVPSGSLTTASPGTGTGPSPGPTEHSRAPGLTTKPGIDGPPSVPRSSIPLPRPRALGNTVLSVEEIDELFMIFITHYHRYLPIIDPGKSPHEYYQSSELLFWSIIAVASRRSRSQPTLLPRLARAVTDLLWKTIRSIPYSLAVVQSLILLCTWPFPTSSSTADPTFMLVGIMLQIGTQMGLHRALDVREFIKVPLKLSSHEYAEWLRTWQACNIVAQSVSVGCGLPLITHVYELSPGTATTELAPVVAADAQLQLHLRIEQFRHRTSQALATQVVDPPGAGSSQNRIALYRLLSTYLDDLANEVAESSSDTLKWYLSAARLHLHAFYLVDDASFDDYDNRILTLYHSAYALIEHSLELGDGETKFFDYCPFFCYQVFVCAAFIILKIITNDFFCTFLDADAGQKILDAAIVALRRVSVVNNDLPARLGDVIGFFCTLSDKKVIGGVNADALRLRQVKNRLSMNVVYDLLWTWRKHFQTEADAPNGGDDQGAGPAMPILFGVDDMQGALDYVPCMQASFGGFSDIDWQPDM